MTNDCKSNHRLIPDHPRFHALESRILALFPSRYFKKFVKEGSKVRCQVSFTYQQMLLLFWPVDGYFVLEAINAAPPAVERSVWEVCLTDEFLKKFRLRLAHLLRI